MRVVMPPDSPHMRPDLAPGPEEIGESSFIAMEGDEVEEKVSLEDLRHAWESLAIEPPAPVVTAPPPAPVVFAPAPASFAFPSAPPSAPAPTSTVRPPFPMAPEVPAVAFPPNLTQPLPRPGLAPVAKPDAQALDKLNATLQRVEAMVRDLHEERPIPEVVPSAAVPVLAYPPHLLAEGLAEMVSSLRSLAAMAAQPLAAPRKKWLGKPDFSDATEQWNAQRDLLHAVLHRGEQLLLDAGVKFEG